nr:MAG TPA: NTP-PPase-like protein [Caudoviricetes sp.]
MNINEFEKEIHKNAVKHGWWDEERSFAEIVALCHSELSEALEEDRAGKPMIYIQDGKPEGKAVEMADCIIRILDWMGRANIDAEDVIATKHAYNETRPYKHGKNY